MNIESRAYRSTQTPRRLYSQRRPSGVAKELPAMSDRDLVSNFLAARSEEAFTQIVQRHTDMVFGVCLRVLGDAGRAEDATQATFMVLFRKIESVRTDTISGWLVRVAVQVAR